MPYIVHELRDKYADNGLSELMNFIEEEGTITSGDLNYLFTELSIAYTNARGLEYQSFNDVEGAHGKSMKEYDRRVVDPYEDMKILLNGDVFPENLTKFGQEDGAYKLVMDNQTPTIIKPKE